ncbi:Gfo/Idh/MocA family protein [Fredinandcohnia humi]
MSTTKIGIVGVALGHPYTFTSILEKKGTTQIYVWEPIKERLEPFYKQFPHAIVCESFEEILSHDVDGAIICTESCFHDTYSIPLMEKGIPIFIDKVMAINKDALTAITNTYRKNKSPVMSTSILRFSPLLKKVQEVMLSKKHSEVLGASTTIFHSIEHYFKEGNTWQDEKDKGGGTLINMGVHGVELIYSLFGKGVKRVYAEASTRYLKATQSEDMSVILLDYGEGLLCTVHLVCGTSHHGYEIDVYFNDQRQMVTIPKGNSSEPLVDYGYEATIDQFLRMVQTGEEPVDFSETIEVIMVLLACRESSITKQWIEVV